jgi:hypothetical protein
MPTQPTKEQSDALSLYANMLEEVKLRIDAINHTLLARTGLLGPFAYEFCFLQLRMLCELVALGCLVAHGDIAKSQKYQKAYRADEIIKKLEGLHPNFYPVPNVELPTGDPRDRHYDDLKEGFLTKADLIALNGRCGDVLHRGSLKALTRTAAAPTILHFPDITMWAQKIVNLLNIHSIMLLGGDNYLLCSLGNSQTGRSQVAFANTLQRPRSPLDPDSPKQR